MKKLNYFVVLILTGLLFSLPEGCYAESKLALIIGNSNYKSSPLSNPVNDARDMADTLAELGFEVAVYTDLNRQGMRQAIRKFGDKLKKSDVGLFYFAGHGIQIGGRNYLIPSQTDITSADEVQDESIDAGLVLRKMETAGNGLNIVILDACRNNPFARSFRSGEQGLAKMDGPVGSFIAYATAPGSVAADGTGRNGLYTQYLLAALKRPQLSIEQTFKYVRNGVMDATRGSQIPWESSSLTGEFMFRPGKASGKTQASAPPPTVTKGYLQIIANAPNATVLVNGIPRGKVDQAGILNLDSLLGDEVEVIVRAKGYIEEKQTVKLSPGKWRQLNISLKTDDTLNPKYHRAKNSRKAESIPPACLTSKRALLISRAERRDFAKKRKVRYDNAALNSIFHQAWRRYGMEFIDADLALKKKLYHTIKNAGIPIFKKISDNLDIRYLLKVSTVTTKAPIKVIKTNMQTFHSNISLDLVDLQSARIIGSASGELRIAGINPPTPGNKKLRRLVNDLTAEIVAQVCE